MANKTITVVIEIVQFEWEQSDSDHLVDMIMHEFDFVKVLTIGDGE